MEREERPGGEQFAEQSGVNQNPFDPLIERTRLNLPDIDEYCMMWAGLAALTVNSPIAAEKRVPVTPEVQHLISQVSNGINFVLFDKISAIQRGSILQELLWLQQEAGISQFVLTHEEGLILRKAAAAVNVEYDPGTPEEVEKRTFKFDDLAMKARGLDVELPYWTKFTSKH